MTKRTKTTLSIVIPISAIITCGMIALFVLALVNFYPPYSYSGEYKDLYSTAVWNIFGVRGYYSGGEYVRDPSIEIYEKEKDLKIYKQINMNSIIKITFGIISNNLKKKIQSLPLQDPCKYMSFILKNNSVDLCLNNNQIKKWYYGLSRR